MTNKQKVCTMPGASLQRIPLLPSAPHDNREREELIAFSSPFADDVHRLSNLPLQKKKRRSVFFWGESGAVDSGEERELHPKHEGNEPCDRRFRMLRWITELSLLSVRYFSFFRVVVDLLH